MPHRVEMRTVGQLILMGALPVLLGQPVEGRAEKMMGTQPEPQAKAETGRKWEL